MTVTLPPIVIPASQVSLWWPVGYGEQPLYQVAVTYNGDASAVATRRVGLRRVELVEDPAPANRFNKTGTTFFFRVNGVEVYAKGSNMIPADTLSPRATDDEWRWLLQSALAANMNMVRVWGGGLYQRDSLYDMADEMGLMLWQEFMFACALYPRDEPFLGLVRAEVTYQVKRLGSHPSIVIWGGNNENEGAIEWYPESDAASGHRDTYVADYLKLYVDTVRDALRRLEPRSERPFVDSSPSNGVYSHDPFVKRFGAVQDWEYGDVHYYDYPADCEDITTYPEARFVSEHGVQSFPSAASYEEVTAPQDRRMSAAMMAYRQRHQDGNAQVRAQMARHLPVPDGDADWPQYLFMTQVQQGRCYEAAIGQWRRLKAVPSIKTMGILYWQLNDIWPGPSWSTIEHRGAWKSSHYFVARAYAPVVTTATVASDDNSTTNIHVTSDLVSALTATVTLELWPWKAKQGGGGGDRLPLATSIANLPAAGAGAPTVAASSRLPPAKVSAQGSVLAAAAKTADLLGGHDPKDVFLRLRTTLVAGTDGLATAGKASNATAGGPGGGAAALPTVPDSFFFFTQLKDANIASPGSTECDVAVTVSAGLTSESASLTVAASRCVAAYVSLEVAGIAGRFDDNSFMLLPGDKPRRLTFTPKDTKTPLPPAKQLEKLIQVRTITG